MRTSSPRDRQPDGEAAPRPGPAVDGHAAPVRLDHVLDQRQPEPAPAAALGLTPSDAVELVEDSLPLGDGDPDPVVRDLDPDLGAPVAPPRRHREPPPLAGVLDR